MSAANSNTSGNKQLTDKQLGDLNVSSCFKQVIPIVQGISSAHQENSDLLYSIITYDVENKMNNTADTLETSQNELDEMTSSTNDALEKLKKMTESIHQKCQKLN
ncbi:hypothetical protein TVAG_380140 [Trichomonas vaginalis G3]|uniref:Uncharacterized protein n=1 Tax=Trichomonas vaginalis (strain ATCC PRA-98 / G3) TaxID=412133 RepID=A2DXF2_TRIV3|nr:hypothetical protein TVAGG3_0925360 [Trichomonas vaginalis G3]EAY14904.1 hypothetical protein TVAG_380140 [Trichomonas vaginalis G3]KAI5485428.1 hypothetical protein TVAGG3_0925360 [Trichomonas vaginalis G3]|eukprot:XP_001327127.1 hypothetical protein [Trichomonas vaginalis G3]